LEMKQIIKTRAEKHKKLKINKVSTTLMKFSKSPMVSW